jgi:polycomb group RING finger protein 3
MKSTLTAGSINPHLTCPLCDGYFRDCHTIPECMHSFCKSCLYKYIANGSRACPTCRVDLGGQPHTAVVFDGPLQTLVDKIYPSLVVQDMADEEEYYRALALEDKRKRSKVAKSASGAVKGNDNNKSNNDEDEQIIIKVAPEQNISKYEELPSLVRPTLKTPVSTTISKLQKFIWKRLVKQDVQIEQDYIRMRCLGNDLDTNMLLGDVRTKYWGEADEGITITYCAWKFDDEDATIYVK